jgi:dihydroorotase-like cyclic amidohydrolase
MLIYGRAVEADGVSPALIEFSGGTITKFTRTNDDVAHVYRTDGFQAYDLQNCLIFPGFVDLLGRGGTGEALAALSGGITEYGEYLDSLDNVVTPHHLFFDTSMLTPENSRFLNVRPPLLDTPGRLRMIQSLRAADARLMISDHHPVTATQKLRGASGVPGFDTFGAMVTWLIKNWTADPVAIWRLACYNPGKVMQKKIGHMVGRLLAGFEASITVLDLTKSPVESRPILSAAQWSPFDFRLLPGSVKTVYLRGEKVVDDLYVRNELPA